MSNRFYALVTFLLSFVVLAYFYHEVLLDPNDYLFAPSGDGIQNYYTLLFHARYDTSFWEFSGMNYPFGEHTVYAGTQPALSWFIGLLGLESYGVGILNFLMLLSFPLCAVFLFNIFRHYQLPKALAVTSSIAIAFLSPQIFRMTGHLSLSATFVIPMMWWLLILSNNGHRRIWSWSIALLILWGFFTHPYLGLILCFFSFFFWVSNSIVFRQKWRIYLSRIVIQVGLPFIIFQVLVHLTDTHADRLGVPAGFFDYHASWKSIFVAHHGPMNYLTVWLDINIGNWESWNYVGLTTALFFGITLVYVVRNRKGIEFKSLFKNELVLFFLTAYFILLFSFCFPLKYPFLRGIVDYFGPLKQFRVLGRFAWIFFYVFTVFSIVAYYRVMLRRGKPIFMQVLLVVGLGFYFVESYPAHRETSSIVNQAKNPFKKNHLDADYNEMLDFIETEKYDAFIYLPFTHLSSENLVLLGTERASFESFVLSYHTGKPMMNAIASRMSLSETILINNFFSPEFIEKELVYLFERDAKIAIVKNNEPLKIDEQRLIWSSDLVFDNEIYQVFNFDAERWNTQYYFDLIESTEKSAIYDVGKGWKSDTTGAWFYYESFDSIKGESFGGEGAFCDRKKGYDVIVELNQAEIDTGLYTVNFWYYLGVDRADVLAVSEQVFLGDKKANWYDTYEVSQSNFIVENWCFVTLDFEFTHDMEKINILLTGNGNNQPYCIDEILVRKQDSFPLFSRKIKNGQTYLIYNNYWIKEDSFKKNR